MRIKFLIGLLFLGAFSYAGAESASAPSAIAEKPPLSVAQPSKPDQEATAELEAEVDASHEQLEAMLQQNRKLAEQTRFLEQEVKRLRSALHEKGADGVSDHIPAGELEGEIAVPTISPASPGITEGVTETGRNGSGPDQGRVSSQEQAEKAVVEPPGFAGVVLGGMVLLLGYWSVLGPYFRARKAV